MPANPFSNYQATLTLTEFLPSTGIFPPRSDDPHADPQGIPLGSIRIFVGSFTPHNSFLAQGQILQTNISTALYALLGNAYGGTPVTTFGLPNLDGTVMVGAGQSGLGTFSVGERFGSATTTLMLSSGHTPNVFNNDQPSLGVTYLIHTGATNGGGVDLPGEILPSAGVSVPDGYLPADGRLLSIAEFSDLYAVIGTTYGGDGEFTFALPDLIGRTPIGASSTNPIGTPLGHAVGTATLANLPPIALASRTAIDNHEPSLAINYLIALQGIFPNSTDGGPDPGTPFVGEIIPYAGTTAPHGWAICDGRVLQISQNSPLFSLLGTTYGGDGTATFALPDLRDRAVAGSGSRSTGTPFGDPVVLTDDEVPSPVVAGTRFNTSVNEQVSLTVNSTVTVFTAGTISGAEVQ